LTYPVDVTILVTSANASHFSKTTERFRSKASRCSVGPCFLVEADEIEELHKSKRFKEGLPKRFVHRRRNDGLQHRRQQVPFGRQYRVFDENHFY